MIRTDQTDEDADELYDIRVGHRVQAPQQRVQQGDGGGDENGQAKVDVQNYLQRGTCTEGQKKQLSRSSTDITLQHLFHYQEL